MISRPMEEFGNTGAGTGNLVSYLNGLDSLEDKVVKAEKVFLTPLNVLPQFKEQIVISWLSNILSSNKVLDYTMEEKCLMWETLRKFLCSDRLKELHSQHWVCSFTPGFIQTLLSTISETTTSADIKKDVLLICDRIISIPTLSPQILILQENSFAFCNSIILYARVNGLPPKLYSLLISVVQRCLSIAKHRMKRVDAIAVLYEKLLFNIMELKYIILKSSSPEYEKLNQEIDNLTMLVFSSENDSLYSTILSLPTKEESKIQMPFEGKGFYGFLVQCISHEDKTSAKTILREFSSMFLKSYIDNEYIPQQYLINIMYLLGITMKEGNQVESNSIAAQAISPSLVEAIYKEQFITSILEALCQVNSDRIQTVWQFPLNTFLMSLSKEIFKDNEINRDTMKCALLMLKLNPEIATENTVLLNCLLSCNSRALMHDTSLYFKTLCQVLDIHIKLRNVDVLYRRISSFLIELENPKKKNLKSLKELFNYDLDKAFESNDFMRNFLISIREMGLQMWMNLWSSVHDLLSTKCHETLSAEGKNIGVKRASAIGLAIWFSSCCLGAMSVLDAVLVSGMADKIANMMNTLAQDCICLLVDDMLMLEEGKSELFSSLMNLVFVWSELHESLLSTDTGYRNFTKYPASLVTDKPEHFCAQTPFLSAEKWGQILSNCYDESDDHCRHAVTQLMIQKLVILKKQRIELESRALKPIDDTIIKNTCLDFVFSVEDTEGFPLSRNLVAFHLPLLISFAEVSHLGAISRMFVSGVLENSECWIMFGRSFAFKECASVHPLVFSQVCERALSLLTTSKRKTQDEEEDLIAEVSSKHLSRRILAILMKVQNVSEKSEFEKNLQLCFGFVSTMLGSSKRFQRLQKQNENEILALLRLLDFFPLTSIQPKLLTSVFALCLIFLVEEGGLDGRVSIVSNVLRIFNRSLSSVHAFWVFKLMKANPFVLLQWSTKQLDASLNFFPAEDSQLRIVLKSECPNEDSGNCLSELLYFCSALTKTFLQWAQLGEKCSKYVETIVEESRSFKNTDASLLAFSAIVAHQKKILENPKTVPNQTIVKAVEIGCTRCVEIAKEVELSMITNVTLSCCLTTFSFVLFLRERLNNRHQKEAEISTPKRGLKRKHNADDAKAIKDKTEESELKVDWEALVLQGERLANLACEANASDLKELGFSFFLNLASSPETATTAGSWNAFQKAWNMPCVRNPSDELALKTLFGKLSPKHYKCLVGKITTTENFFEGQTMEHLITIIAADVPNSLSHTKKVAIDQVISLLCIQLASPNLCQESSTNIIKVLQVFFAAINTKSLLTHSKAIILSACEKIPFESISNSAFLKVFDCTSKILQHILLKDYAFAAKRTASVMSLFTRLVSDVIRRSGDEQSLSETQVKELVKCGDVLEMLVTYVKRNYVQFTRVVPFSLAKMIERMQETTMNQLVKESIQRIIYTLMDVSDNYCLLHLMVSLRPATAAVLKQMYTTFSHNYKFNPRT